MRKIVVTGANGMVGAAVVKNLYKDYVLVAIDRHKDRIAPFIEIANGLQFVMSDILSVSDWKAILGGAYAVVHLAANVHWTPRTSEEIANFYKVNTEGTRLLINKSAEYGVKKFLFFSTNDVYRSSDHEIDESEPLDASSIYAKTKLEAENLILQAYSNGPLDVLILRPASIYGEYDTGSMTSLISLCKHGVVPVIGPGENVKALLYVKEVANFASGNYSFVQIINTINDVFDLNSRVIKLPLFLKDNRIFAKSKNFQKLKAASESKKVNFDKIKRSYGFVSSYDLKAGLTDSLEYYKEFCKLEKRKK